MGHRRFEGKTYTPGTVRNTPLFIAANMVAVVSSCFNEDNLGALPLALTWCLSINVCPAVPNKLGISGILLAYVPI